MKSGTHTYTLADTPLEVDWQADFGDPSVGIGPGFEICDVRLVGGASLWDMLDDLGALDTLQTLVHNHLLNHTQELE
jgi:hypothetical protein